MDSMVQAGAMGLPFIAVRGLLVSDILTYRPDLLVRDNPFNPGEPVVLARPIRPDVAVCHALQADRWGNTITPGKRDDLMPARAARGAVVTAEEVVDQELTVVDAGHHNTFLPAIDVDMVAHVPFGAHACGCGPLYPRDEAHCRHYIEAAGDEASFKAYLERYVYGLPSHVAYLDRVGISTSHNGPRV
jgi:glutaconate CoA-transferase subunit A